jgi:hypothetical protein
MIKVNLSKLSKTNSFDMAWNYRIIKQKGVYSIREVIYLEEGEGWTEDEVSPYGETRDEFRESMTNYLEAVHKPVLIVEGDAIVGEELPITELNNDER